MQYKRARTAGEVANEVAAAMSDVGDEQRDVEQAAPLHVRVEVVEIPLLDADMQWCGLSGSPTKVHRIQSIVLTKEGYTEIPPTEEGVKELIHELIADHTLG